MVDFNEFCLELFQILRSYGRDMVLYDDNGTRVYEPEYARRIYMTNDNVLVSVTDDGDNSSLRLYLSPSMNLSQSSGFIDTLRTLATQSNLLFHVKKFNKEIKPQDFASRASVTEQENNNMNLLEGMYGTSKSSYLKLENARMIVRHSERVKENMIGARGRAISQIFVENAQGERLLFPVNTLSGARAMTQHVNQGGTFADDIGQQIIRMAQDFKGLARAAQHVQTNRAALPESATGLRESIIAVMKETKSAFNRVYEARSYTRACASLVEASQLMEDGEQVAEKLAALKSILGEGLEDEVMATVARKVALPQAQEPVVEDTDIADASPEASEDEPSDVGVSIEVKVEGEAEDEMPAPNNSIVQEFDSWMANFDPEFSAPQPEVEEDATEVMADELGMTGDATEDDVGFGDQIEDEITTEGELEEANLFVDGKHKPGSTMAVASHPNDPNGQYSVSFKPDSNSPRGHTKHVTVASNLASAEEAQQASRDYAAKHGLNSIDRSETTEDEAVEEARVKKDAAPELTMHDVKATVAHFKAKLAAMSPFDPGYPAARSAVMDAEKELAKLTPYGKAAMAEDTTDTVAEAFDSELIRLMTLAGRKQ